MGLGFNDGFAPVKPFDEEFATLGNYILTRSDYDDADGFVKNWWEIFRKEGNEYISIHTINGFSYSTTGIREYFINYVQKLHNEAQKKTI